MDRENGKMVDEINYLLSLENKHKANVGKNLSNP
jgi:hypothetical protein